LPPSSLPPSSLPPSSLPPSSLPPSSLPPSSSASATETIEAPRGADSAETSAGARVSEKRAVVETRRCLRKRLIIFSSGMLR
jgi:hypothetical protein